MRSASTHLLMLRKSGTLSASCMNLFIFCVLLNLVMLRAFLVRAFSGVRLLSARTLSNQATGASVFGDGISTVDLKTTLTKSLRKDIKGSSSAVSTMPKSNIVAEPTRPSLSVTSFNGLGLESNIISALEAQGIYVPTPVQKAVIPRLLNKESLVMAASTGSGKTLAYMLPCIQNMHVQEQEGYIRKAKRPRCLVLVPTRELARQVLDSVKKIGHYSKVSSTAVLGGEQYGTQKKDLDRLVDVVVASPGRLMEHKKQGNVYFSQVTHVVIDEVDTMLTQGFGPDIRAILRGVISREHDLPSTTSVQGHSAGTTGKRKEASASVKAEAAVDQQSRLSTPVDLTVLSAAAQTAQVDAQPRQPAQLVMATATLTKAVRALLSDVQGGFNVEFADPTNKTPRLPQADDARVKLSIVEVDGVHRSLPNVTHRMEDVKGGRDKLELLRDVLARHHSKGQRTLIFCNTVASCRAVEYALNQDAVAGGSFAGDDEERRPVDALSYHGDLHSSERQANLDKFRSGELQYLVCTDIAARGLDIPETGHVVMFDFPLNPIDYLHRAGRCGRAGRRGLVTSLVAKRDLVLANAIEKCIENGLPIDSLTSDKKDYTGTGKLTRVLRPARSPSPSDRDHRSSWTSAGRSSRRFGGAERYGGPGKGKGAERSRFVTAPGARGARARAGVGAGSAPRERQQRGETSASAGRTAGRSMKAGAGSSGAARRKVSPARAGHR